MKHLGIAAVLAVAGCATPASAPPPDVSLQEHEVVVHRDVLKDLARDMFTKGFEAGRKHERVECRNHL